MNQIEADAYCDEFLRQAKNGPIGLGVAGLNKLMNAFVQSTYFQALKKK